MYATLFFPIGAIGITVFSLFYPAILAQYSKAIVPLLGIVMLGMGMTLRPENFLEILKRPKLIALGTCLQFLLMPLAAWLVSLALDLSTDLMVGFVLLGACPGGTASNVICYLARGDVALSITLTTVSTLLAVFLTPLMTLIYVGEKVPVPVLSMMLDIFLVIVLPVVAGMIVNYYFSKYIHFVKHILPFISVFAIIIIIGIIVALNQHKLPMLALPVITAVFWHNAIGLAGGYFLSGFFTKDERIRRTMAIEVGMQNSGLSVVLAQAFFPAVASLPGALFSIWHNITGSLLAGYWSHKSHSSSKENLF